jgi:hypothetical protein
MSVILATAGYDHKIRFWEAPSGICSRILKYPDSQVNKLEITPDKVRQKWRIASCDRIREIFQEVDIKGLK